MRFLGQRLLVAALGVFILGSAAEAQAPVAARPAKSYRMAFPGEAVAAAPAAPAVIEEVTWKASVTPAAALADAPTAPTVAGCCGAPAAPACGSTCDDPCAKKKSCGHSGPSFLTTMKARLFSPSYACENPVGCGNCKSEKNFAFGSCCQFFTPGRECGSCGDGCGGSRYWKKCPPIIYGPGTGAPFNTCAYDSYLNH